MHEIHLEFVEAHLREYLVAHSADADVQDFCLGVQVMPYIPAQELVKVSWGAGPSLSAHICHRQK